MSFMRLGTRVAVFNDTGRILLSKRGDFGTWNLPGGRLDSGELLHESAVREVREETGLQVEIERPVGLYFQQGRHRTNILYRAKPIGGELLSETDETQANRFFPPDDLPEPLYGAFYIEDAKTYATYVRTLTTPRWELFKLNMRLRRRWLQNLLAGRPEPPFVEFDVRAVGIVFDPSRKRVLTMGGLSLIEARSDGSRALDDALSHAMHFSDMMWEWVGLYQEPGANRIDFVFEAQDAFMSDLWEDPGKLADARHRQYAQKQRNRRRDVWLMTD